MEDIPDRLLVPLIVCMIICPVNVNFAQAPIFENTDGFIIYQDSIVAGVSSPDNTALNSVLSGFVDKDDISYGEAILLQKIIECESGWKNVCNGEYGCYSGQGIVQLIPTTVKYCEKGLEKTINPFNIQDSIQCAIWLLKNEGWQHWGTNETEWGSYQCFKYYIN